MIIAAAIKLDNGLILTLPQPERHPTIILESGLLELTLNYEDGFLTNTGEFLTRIEASQHAVKCGQILRKKQPHWLQSEELW